MPNPKNYVIRVKPGVTGLSLPGEGGRYSAGHEEEMSPRQFAQMTPAHLAAVDVIQTPAGPLTPAQLDALATDAELAGALAGLPTAYEQVIGDGLALAYTVTHNKGTRAVVVSVRETAGTEAFVIPTVEAGTDPLNQIVLRFNTAPAVGQYRVVVL